MDEAKRAFLRFPFVLIMAALAGAEAIRLIHRDHPDDEGKLVSSLALGIPLFLALTLYRESRGLNLFKHRLIEYGVGLAFLLAHYLITVGDDTNAYFFKYMQVSLALHLLVAFIPFTQERDENQFWQFNRYIFLRILLSCLYAAVFYGGICIALLTIGKLFSVKIEGERFFELWIFSVAILQTWHFLTGVPYVKDLKGDASYPKGLRFFVQYLLIPLVSLYMIILYTYMGKIVFTQVWPSGYIGWLVSVMSVLGIFNLLLIDPEKHKSENRWIAAYSKFYYILILPLIVMLFIAIGKRVSEYGVTESRYFLIALGTLLTGLAIYFVFSKRKNIRVVPISLFALALLTVWGPWSAYNVSLRNQTSRAKEIMERNGLLVNGKTQKAKASVSADDEKNLSSIFDYILQHHGARYVSEWFPQATIDQLRFGNDGSYVTKPIKARRQSSGALMEHLGLKYKDRWDQVRNIRFYLTSTTSKDAFNVAGYEQALLLDISTYNNANWEGFEYKKRFFKVGIEKAPAQFTLLEDGKEILNIPLADMIMKLRAPTDNVAPSTNLKPEQMTVEGSANGVSIRVVIKHMGGEVENSTPKLDSLDGILLIR